MPSARRYPAGTNLPSSVVRARTRQVLRFKATHGCMPARVFELEPPPHAAGMLLLAACDRQQAVIERHEARPGAGTAPRSAPAPA